LLTSNSSTRPTASRWPNTSSTVQSAEQRVQRLTTALTKAVQGWRFEPVVAALRALRGIGHDERHRVGHRNRRHRRFSTARQLMGYLGLVPSEQSSGQQHSPRSITKTGNAHARRLLTRSRMELPLPGAHQSQPPGAQRVLPEAVRSQPGRRSCDCARFARLSSRGVQVNKVCVAVARELSGFVWAIARQASPAVQTIH
jgi:hypothetical protein